MALQLPQNRRPRILITDDSATQRRVIREELAELCVDLCEACNGAEALKAIGEFEPDLVTLDIEMPILNGTRVLEQIKSMEQTMTLPVIMISSLENETQRLKALEGGAIEYFRKPFAEGALRQLVSEVLGRLERNRRKTVCCVDESEQIRRYVKQLVETHGYQCKCFATLEEMRDYLLDGTCDLLLLDLHLPNHSSYEFLEQTRESSSVSMSMAKVGTTGFGARRDLLNAFQLGVDDFIRKPFYAEELLARIDNQLKVKEAETLLKQIATIDTLTELHNRGEMARRFITEVSRARRDSSDLGVLMLDVDHFKQVNDRFGHPVGDQVLRKIAHSLRDNLRVTDVIGRYGGEEFVAFLPRATHSGAMLLADRLREHVCRLQFPVDGAVLDASISIGVCIWPHEMLQPEMTMDHAIRPADQALYSAKRAGRNRCMGQDPPRLPVSLSPSSFRRMGRSVPAPE